MSLTAQDTELLKQFEYREEGKLFCEDHKGKIFQLVKSYETFTGTTRKYLFKLKNDASGILYEQKVKRKKERVRDPLPMKIIMLKADYCEISCFDSAERREDEAKTFNHKTLIKLAEFDDFPKCTKECPKFQAEKKELAKSFQTNKPKTFYKAVGYRFAQFSPPLPPKKSKIDEKPFIERFTHTSMRRALLQDMKLLFDLQNESSIPLEDFISLVIDCYEDNLVIEHIASFVEIIEKIIRTAKSKTTTGYKYAFTVRKEHEDIYDDDGSYSGESEDSTEVVSR